MSVLNRLFVCLFVFTEKGYNVNDLIIMEMEITRLNGYRENNVQSLCILIVYVHEFPLLYTIWYAERNVD